jgi:hypothetical protein
MIGDSEEEEASVGRAVEACAYRTKRTKTRTGKVSTHVLWDLIERRRKRRGQTVNICGRRLRRHLPLGDSYVLCWIRKIGP